jgi:plasmid stabilization system protein ParE
MSFRVLISQTAERDIHQAVAWWSDHRSRAEAERWYERIYPAIATLSRCPERCPLAPESDLLVTELRHLHFGVRRKTTHRIVFTIQDQEVIILRVRHVAQRELESDDLT